MAYETIKYEVDEQILTITLNRPGQAQRLQRHDAGRIDRRLRCRRQADDNVARDHRHRRRPRLLRRRRPLLRRRHLRSRRAARAGEAARRRQGRLQRSAGARRRRPGHAADLQMPEAGDRRDQRPGGRHRRHHAAGDGYPHRLRKRAVRLRVLAARHRAGGGVELVPAAHRRHRPGAGMVLFRPRVSGAGSARRPPRQQGRAAGRVAADRARAGQRDSSPRPRRCRWR